MSLGIFCFIIISIILPTPGILSFPFLPCVPINIRLILLTSYFTTGFIICNLILISEEFSHFMFYFCSVFLLQNKTCIAKVHIFSMFLFMAFHSVFIGAIMSCLQNIGSRRTCSKYVSIAESQTGAYTPPQYYLNE